MQKSEEAFLLLHKLQANGESKIKERGEFLLHEQAAAFSSAKRVWWLATQAKALPKIQNPTQVDVLPVPVAQEFGSSRRRGG